MRAGADPGRRLSYLAAAAFTVAASVIAQLVVAAMTGLREGAETDLVTLVLAKVLGYVVVLFALLRSYEPETSVRTVLGLRAMRPVEIVLGAAVGGLLAPAAALLDGVIAEKRPPSPEEQAWLERIFVADTLGRRIAIVVALGLIMPAVDELFFRGALATSLARGRRLATALLAAAAYDALVPLSSRGLFSFVGVIAVLTLLRLRSASVGPSLAARVAFFATSVAPVALGRDELGLSLRASMLALGGAALAGAVFLAVTRDRASPHAD